jgi:hypothetical protein
MKLPSNGSLHSMMLDSMCMLFGIYRQHADCVDSCELVIVRSSTRDLLLISVMPNSS